MTGQQSKSSGAPSPRPNRRRRGVASHNCPLCHQPQRYFRTCRCGFEMCQSCMDDNLWGVTCNHITWVCPDCGEPNSF
jgi:hypothetical protein